MQKNDKKKEVNMEIKQLYARLQDTKDAGL